MIRVLFFANLRDAAGLDSYEIESDGITNIRELVAKLGKILPSELSEALEDESAMVSVDHKYAGWDAPVGDRAEVGFLPPVSGG